MRYLAFILLIGCDRSYYYEQANFLPTWDPESTTVCGGSVYALMPRAGVIAQFTGGGGDPNYVDVRPHRFQSMLPLPDIGCVLARTVTTRCEEELPERDPSFYDCPYDAVRYDEAVRLISDGVASEPIPLEPGLGPLHVSPDGRFAAALADAGADDAIGGLVNLTAMQVIALDTNESWIVSTGFAASDVLFLQDAAGVTDAAIVLAPNEVAVVDLTAQSPDPEVVFPLRLDGFGQTLPRSVSVTPDRAHALVTIQNSSDLFVLDLVAYSINILSLRGVPTTLTLDPDGDRTFIGYTNSSVIEAVDHGNFDLRAWTTHGPVDRMEVRDDVLFAWNHANGAFVERIDLATDDQVSWPLNYASGELFVSPDNAWALTTPSAYPARFELLDLAPGVDGELDTDPRPFGLDGVVLDAAFDSSAGAALLLQETEEDVLRVRWPSLEADAIALSQPPVAIGAMPTGGWFITHADPQGLLSFLSTNGDVAEIGGFALHDLLTDQPIVGPEGAP
jgi:hypothetical protein